MKTLFVILDTLRRDYLEPYGTTWVKTPNIARLAERSVVCDNHWVGSLPCMPGAARVHDRSPQLSRTRLGSTRAVRRRLAEPAAPGQAEGNLLPSDYRPLPLLLSRRRGPQQ